MDDIVETAEHIPKHFRKRYRGEWNKQTNNILLNILIVAQPDANLKNKK